MKLLRTICDKVANGFGFALLIAAAITPAVVVCAWLTVLPSIGLLWVAGWLK